MNEVLYTVKVGIAGLDIVEHPGTISTIGLGSCVGAVIYDEQIRIAGLVHVMLPDSSISKVSEFKRGKFADTGIAAIIEMLLQKNAKKNRMKAKIAGGAQMFTSHSREDTIRIGPRNIDAVREVLAEHKIPIIAEDVGGNKGRTIEFSTENLLLKVRTIQQGEQFI
ncbi:MULTISPECIES: chemotaxis protein CheD [Allobacillus]|uniref:Probable chemoreceptor glutamine deamidase CheD n=1 Tax=Allobacillus salarius TaxID=1955272 RepID=A0A556PS19_9BACI|nr:chemotaxis protein CheD [Allobacillus salarius]TSJ67173.1 chemotaxis protein CheD [Allobacillus salarius]